MPNAWALPMRSVHGIVPSCDMELVHMMNYWSACESNWSMLRRFGPYWQVQTHGAGIVSQSRLVVLSRSVSGIGVQNKQVWHTSMSARVG